MESPSLRILLVDDHLVFLDSLASFLSQHPQVEIVGRASSGPEAIELARSLSPDLVLMDMVMPGMNGIEATERIKAESSSPIVIVLTLHDGPEWSELALQAGADGFIPKREFVRLLPQVLGQLIPQSSFDSSFFERDTAPGHGK